MPPKTRSISMKKIIRCFSILLAVLVISSCYPKSLADQSSCSIDMRMTIDVTDARPREVFDQLSNGLNCNITIYPFFWQTVTVHMENAKVSEILAAVCEQIDCKYTFDGKRLSIVPLTGRDKRNIQAQEEWQRKFEVRIPEGMRFVDATVRSVLAEISAVSGLEITPWEEEGDRKVTLDISGMTVDEALEAVVRQIDNCEGVVLIKWWDGHSIAQHRLVDKP